MVTVICCVEFALLTMGNFTSFPAKVAVTGVEFASPEETAIHVEGHR